MSNLTPPVIAPNPPAGAPTPPSPVTHRTFRLTPGTPPDVAGPDVTSVSAHPRRKRASAAFWILLVAILVIGFGFMAIGGFGSFGGY
jgi:hypothetical protein